MSALNIDVTIEQGADFQREFTVTKLDGTDLPSFTSFTFESMLRDKNGVLIDELEVTATSSKTMLLWIKNAQTELLINGKDFYYKFDIEAESLAGLKYRLVQARVTSSLEQTKPDPTE